MESSRYIIPFFRVKISFILFASSLVLDNLPQLASYQSRWRRIHDFLQSLMSDEQERKGKGKLERENGAERKKTQQISQPPTPLLLQWNLHSGLVRLLEGCLLFLLLGSVYPRCTQICLFSQVENEEERRKGRKGEEDGTRRWDERMGSRKGTWKGRSLKGRERRLVSQLAS